LNKCFPKKVQMVNKYMKCSVSLVIKKMQLKLLWDTILSKWEWLLSRKQKNNADKDAGEKEPLFTVSGNMNFPASRKISMEVPQKILNAIQFSQMAPCIYLMESKSAYFMFWIWNFPQTLMCCVLGLQLVVLFWEGCVNFIR
jgi:hypothetical protein